MPENSSIKQMAMNIAKDLCALTHDCSDEEFLQAADMIRKEYNPEYINPKDYCNADDAMDILGLRGNRTKFFKLLKEHNVKPTKINNQPIGYKITEIEGLKVHINS